MNHLRLNDPDVFDAIVAEEHRQRDELELIASENYTSAAVMEAVGSVLTNKYAEGLPGKRYYGGCENVDSAERLAIERAKQLFGAEHVNVQPHSGATANQAVYYAALEIGDTVLAMDLAQGGHLTHGMKLNFSGRWYPTIGYGVDPKTERIDYDNLADARPRAQAEADPRRRECLSADHRLRPDGRDREGGRRDLLRRHGPHRRPRRGRACIRARCPMPTSSRRPRTRPCAARAAGSSLCKESWGKKIDSAVFPGLQGGPLEHVIAGKAVCLGEALRPDFKAYAAQVIANAKTLAEELISAGFRLISGGTDNHLILIDMTSKGLTGKIAEAALGRAGITVNKNLIPFDTRKPLDPSGIRMGTPALTTRGMKEDAIGRSPPGSFACWQSPEDEALAGRRRGRDPRVRQGLSGAGGYRPRGQVIPTGAA